MSFRLGSFIRIAATPPEVPDGVVFASNPGVSLPRTPEPFAQLPQTGRTCASLTSFIALVLVPVVSVGLQPFGGLLKRPQDVHLIFVGKLFRHFPPPYGVRGPAGLGSLDPGFGLLGLLISCSPPACRRETTCTWCTRHQYAWSNLRCRIATVSTRLCSWGSALPSLPTPVRLRVAGRAERGAAVALHVVHPRSPFRYLTCNRRSRSALSSAETLSCSSSCFANSSRAHITSCRSLYVSALRFVIVMSLLVRSGSHGVMPVVSDDERERVVERATGFDPVFRSPDRPAAVGAVGTVRGRDRPGGEVGCLHSYRSAFRRAASMSAASASLTDTWILLAASSSSFARLSALID